MTAKQSLALHGTRADMHPIDPETEGLAGRLKGLAHPARLTILRTLAARGTCVCGEMVDVLPLAQATVSQHLRTLRSVGLVRGTVDGPRTCYCLDPAGVRDLARELETFLAEIRAGLDALEAEECVDVCG